MSQDIFPILVPQVNVNDDTVTFIRWRVDNGSYVKKDGEICEIETTKALFIMSAEQEGVIYQIAAANSAVRVGSRIGLIGPRLDSIKAFLLKEDAVRNKALKKQKAKINVTSKARSLADKHGIDLKQVVEMGVRGTIKESDILKYLARQEGLQPEKPGEALEKGALQVMLKYAKEERHLTRYESFVSQKLKASLQNIVYATIDAQINLSAVNSFIKKCKDKGSMIGLAHIIMYALGKTLPRFPLLTKFQFNNRVYKYRKMDIGIIAKAFDGLLYTLIVRETDKLSLEQVAQTCQSLLLRASRHELNAGELEGACFAISYIPNNVVTRFAALQDRFQSAILAIAGEHNILSLFDGKVVQSPATTLTLSYDHTLMDGWYAADFLASLIKEIEGIVS